MTWNNQPCGTNFDDGTDCNLTAESNVITDGNDDNTWQCWNVIYMTDKDYTQSNTNVTVALRTAGAGNPDSYYSGDYSNASLIPYLNISYNTTINTAEFNLGARTNGSGVFNGNIDEPAIHFKELTSGEVTWIYNSGFPKDLTGGGSPSNLQGWWRMGDGDTYPTLTDNSVNSNDGTMTSMAADDIVVDAPFGIARPAIHGFPRRRTFEKRGENLRAALAGL